LVRKVKGHIHDPWNDLADSLAVKVRNQQSKEVMIQLVFRAVLDKKEQFVGFDRFPVQSHANIHDFWPRLVQSEEVYVHHRLPHPQSCPSPRYLIPPLLSYPTVPCLDPS
jgi:hypothetical protein